MRTAILVLALVFHPLVLTPMALQGQRGADTGPVAQLNDARKLAEQAVNQLRAAQTQATELAGNPSDPRELLQNISRQRQLFIETLNNLQTQLAALQKSPNREAVIGAADANNTLKQDQLQARAKFAQQQLDEGVTLSSGGNGAGAASRFNQAAQQDSRILAALEQVVRRLGTAAQSAKNSPVLAPATPRPPTLERLLTLPATAASKASIEGVVFATDTRKPVPNATVSLLRSGRMATILAILENQPSPEPIAPMTTDENGRFAFPGLEADAYTVTVFKPGYTLQANQKLDTGIPATPIKLEAGIDIRDLELPLARNGSLSGQVRDLRGNPAPGVPVQLLRSPANSPGNSRLVAETKSNARGEYRIDDVVPDPYILAAGDALTLGPLTQTLRSANPEYGYTFYPGTLSADLATELLVGAAELKADFSLGPELRHRIRGRVVVDEASGSWPTAVTSSLTSVTPTGIDRGNFAANDALVRYEPMDGTFEVSDLLPGTYTILMRTRVESRDLVNDITVVVRDDDIGERILLSTPMTR